jgi:two-component system phosphate regulon response regulator PhoB
MIALLLFILKNACRALPTPAANISTFIPLEADENILIHNLCADPAAAARVNFETSCRVRRGGESDLSAMNDAQSDIANRLTASRVLVVEDDTDLALLLTYNLRAGGYVAESVERGEDAELRIRESPPDLVILDWTVPGISGLEICTRLRACESTRTLPIMMLTARGEEAERVRGLTAGADDYVVKPLSLPELIARVRGLLRRSRTERMLERLSAGDLELDPESRRVYRGSRDVQLKPTEFRLFECLLKQPGRVFTREKLLARLWGDSAKIDARTIDVHVGRLRKTLSRGRERDPIRTVRRVGYSFDETFGK